jgi:hypothetical protein
VAREGVGEEETRRPFIRAARGDGEVTTGGGIRCATAPRPTHVRPAPRTDRGSAARTARVQRRGSRRLGQRRASGGVGPRATHVLRQRSVGKARVARPSRAGRRRAARGAATSRRGRALPETILLITSLKRKNSNIFV